jgi:hypothetical protein
MDPEIENRGRLSFRRRLQSVALIVVAFFAAMELPPALGLIMVVVCLALAGLMLGWIRRGHEPTIGGKI